MLIDENNNVILDDIHRKAILVGLSNFTNEYDIQSSMLELKELAKAVDVEVMAISIQNKDKIDPTYYIGKGKVEEIKYACEINEANLVIFNDELSGGQMRNLENALDIKVIDRTALILDIFAIRAKTKIAKLQVELAELRYRLPRLQGIGASLSKTGAGIGTRGLGEQKLELDKRVIRERISDVKRQIADAKKTREVQRTKRSKNDIPIVAIVGYTNAGKSTLMNKVLEMSSVDDIDDKKVFVKNMLFATLDTYSRRITLDENRSFILIDTVGFVSKLPHGLVEAFKATLEEVKYADILLNVVDISSEFSNMQMSITQNVLSEIGAGNKEMFTVFNKVDLIDNGDFIDVEDTLVNKEKNYYISAESGFGIESLIEGIKKHIFNDIIKTVFFVPFSDGRILSEICDVGKVLNTEYLENGTKIEIELHQKDYNKYIKFCVGD